MKSFAWIAVWAACCLGARADDVKVYLDSTNGSSAFIIYDAQSNELMRILSNGRIGVGAEAPSNQLHVAGAMQVDTSTADGHGILITEIPEPEGPGWPVIGSSDGITVAGQGDAELAGGYGNAELKCQANGTVVMEGSRLSLNMTDWGQGPYEGTNIIRAPDGSNTGVRAIYHSGLLWRVEEY